MALHGHQAAGPQRRRACRVPLRGAAASGGKASHLGYGVYAIATARVEGTPLSEERIDDVVQHSAVAALSRVHAASGGLCHGDVRLEILMLVERDAGPSHCVVLDFGQARLDGDGTGG